VYALCDYMKNRIRPIAVAEDDLDDRELTRDAFAELHVSNPLTFFNDGADLLEYLRNCMHDDDRDDELPAMVLLDLNMPRIDGRQALRLIRADARLQHLPVVVLSTSRSESDISESYQDGASSFITKPTRFQGLVDALRSLDRSWFEPRET
jgi:two-component system response regulator